ncbi:MAG: hypothetical protein WBE85_17945 [Methylocella sp.]
MMKFRDRLLASQAAIKALRIKEIKRKNYNEPQCKLGINAYDGGREQAINRSVCKANDG